MTRHCAFCGIAFEHSHSPKTCGARACLVELAAERRAIDSRRAREEWDAGAPVPAKLYKRKCSRCNVDYEGTGRMLCDRCRHTVNQMSEVL